MTPWLGTPTSYASGYINAHRVVSSVPSGPWPPTFQSLTVELSSPPTYWMGLLTRSSRGSRALNRDSPGIGPWYVRPGTALKIGGASGTSGAGRWPRQDRDTRDRRS